MTARQRDSAATRSAILAAARRRFLADGFGATTTRAVAADVGVDAALVSRYFGSKEGLWEAATSVDLDLPDFTATGTEEIGERLIETFLDRWEGESGGALRVLLAASTSDPRAAARVRAVFADQVRGAVAHAAVDQPARRTELVVTTLLGLALCRYVLRLPGIAGRSRRAVRETYAPALQHALIAAL